MFCFIKCLIRSVWRLCIAAPYFTLFQQSGHRHATPVCFSRSVFTLFTIWAWAIALQPSMGEGLAKLQTHCHWLQYEYEGGTLHFWPLHHLYCSCFQPAGLFWAFSEIRKQSLVAASTLVTATTSFTMPLVATFYLLRRLVWSVLLCGCECWPWVMTKEETRDSGNVIRRMLRTLWS